MEVFELYLQWKNHDRVVHHQRYQSCHCVAPFLYLLVQFCNFVVHIHYESKQLQPLVHLLKKHKY